MCLGLGVELYWNMHNYGGLHKTKLEAEDSVAKYFKIIQNGWELVEQCREAVHGEMGW